MRLTSLAKLEKIELENEKKELINNIANLEDILAKEDKQIAIIRERLESLVKKYGDTRRTELLQIEVPKEEKEIAEVVPVDVVVVTTESGLIKKVPVSSYKVQRKGGKGAKSTDDAIMSTIKTNTVDYMMFFTNTGKMFRTVVDNIPDGTNTTKGVPINSLIQLDNNEKVIAVTSLHRKSIPKFAIFITKNGLFKKTFLSEYLGAKRNAGIAAIKLKEGDSVANVIFQDDEDMVIITKEGMSIRFETKGIGAAGRNTMGVKGINLKENDEVISALPIHKDTDYIGIFTENGMGKKIKIEDLPKQARGGKGTIASKKPVAGAAMISDEDNILLSGLSNSICISAKEVPLSSKIAEGNIMTHNRVVSISKI
jgi:DNA gyrase subunit A